MAATLQPWQQQQTALAAPQSPAQSAVGQQEQQQQVTAMRQYPLLHMKQLALANHPLLLLPLLLKGADLLVSQQRKDLKTPSTLTTPCRTLVCKLVCSQVQQQQLPHCLMAPAGLLVTSLLPIC
jgi:hypothetical protein